METNWTESAWLTKATTWLTTKLQEQSIELTGAIEQPHADLAPRRLLTARAGKKRAS